MSPKANSVASLLLGGVGSAEAGADSVGGIDSVGCIDSVGEEEPRGEGPEGNKEQAVNIIANSPK